MVGATKFNKRSVWVGSNLRCFRERHHVMMHRATSSWGGSLVPILVFHGRKVEAWSKVGIDLDGSSNRQRVGGVSSGANNDFRIFFRSAFSFFSQIIH